MIKILIATIFGAVQGVAEFLPVSSMGHLIILHEIFPEFTSDPVSFDIALHAGTLTAVIVLFRKDVFGIVRSVYRTSLGKATREEYRLILALIIATVPAAVLGAFFADFIESILRDTFVVAISLFVGGMLFIATKNLQGSKSLEDIGYLRPLLVGVGQSLALIPGVSRSGSTILTALVTGFDRSTAVKFSFLLSIPITAGAVLSKIGSFHFSGEEKQLLIAGFLSSMFVGALTIRWLMRFIQRHSFTSFGWYRIVLSCVILALHFFL